MSKFLIYGIIQCVLISNLLNLINCQCYDDETGFFPDDAFCDKYIECNNGKLVNVTFCADGLIFVQQSKLSNRAICQLPFNADCGSRTKLQEPQPSKNCPRQNGYFKHESDCNKFYQCVNGKSFLNECPSSLAFNEENGNCDWSNTCVSTPKAHPDGLNNDFVCPSEPEEKDFGNYPEPRYAHSTDCKKFYICLVDPSGKRSARLNACSYGLVYSEQTKNCETPDKVPECAKTYNEELDETPEDLARNKAAKLKAAQRQANNSN